MRSLIALAVFAAGCAPWTPPGGPAATPTPGPTPTPSVPGIWTPAISDALLLNPDHGWIASNPNRSWEAITSRIGGGEPYRVASVIDTTLSLAEWMEPSDGADPEDAANGSAAGRVQEALDHGRYVALGIYADDVSDLPSAWTTTDVPFDPAGPDSFLADGLFSVIDLGDRLAPNYADPDYWQQLQSVVAALGDRFGDGPGVAVVHVSGFGDRGSFTFADPDPWFTDPGAPFTEVTWPVHTSTMADTWGLSFPGATAFLSWQSIEHAFDEDTFLDFLANEEFHLADGCIGGCAAPEFDRLPGGDGTPFPDDDPFGGWLPGELTDSKMLLSAGGLGGIADWRLAEEDGSWDAGEYGSVDAYTDLVFSQTIANSSLRFATLSDSACRSEWVTAADPVGSPCGSQTVGDLWEPIEEFGRRMGTRYAVTEVRAASPEVTGSVFSVEIDIVNLADGVEFLDREIEVGFQDSSDGEPLDVLTFAPDPPMSQWTPGSTITLLVDVPTQTLNAQDPPTYALYMRIVDERAFGGGIQMAHDDRDESGRHTLVRWPAE